MPMLSQPQANALAEGLIEAGKAERTQRLEADAARIPRAYRSVFPPQVPAWRRAQLFGEARRTAGSVWAAGAMGVCALWLVGVLWIESEEHLRVSAALCLAMPAVAGMFGLLRTALVKLKLQQMLLQELASRPTDGT